MKTRFLFPLLPCLLLTFGCSDPEKKIPTMGNVLYTKTDVPNGTKPPVEYIYEVTTPNVLLTLPADWTAIDVGQSSRLKAIFGQEDVYPKDSIKFLAMSPDNSAMLTVQQLDLSAKLWGRKTLREEIDNSVRRMEDARCPVTYSHVRMPDGSLRDRLRCEPVTKAADGKMGVLYCTQYFLTKGNDFYVVTMMTSTDVVEHEALFDKIGKTFSLVE